MLERTCLILLFMMLGALLGPANAEPLKIAAVGDIMLAGRYSRIIARHGADYPFAATAGLLKSADVTVGNLEAPLTAQGTEFRSKRFRFRAPPEMAQALQRAGFKVLTLANNHILDYGADGLADTLLNLSSALLASAGAGESLALARKPAMISSAGRIVAVLAYSLTQPTDFYATFDHAGTAPAYVRHIESDIRAARRQADVIVVSFHWGDELEAVPRPIQQSLAHLAIDAGASIVVGHHPHILQGIEFYRNGIICYSLGNFAFGSASRAATQSMIAMLTLSGNAPPELEIIPLSVDNRKTDYQPRPLTGVDAEESIARLRELSLPLGTRIISNGSRYRALPKQAIEKRNEEVDMQGASERKRSFSEAKSRGVPFAR